MKKLLAIFLLLKTVSGFCQTAPKPYGALPTKAQLNWHEMEMYCIIHFGVDTYTDKEWGFGDENPVILNPKKFDAAQIVGAAKAGGFKGVVIVAKHHDGLCLWPTRTTEHNITKTSWKNGKGDMLKEYQLACQKLGMQMGLYCSPWDRNSAFYGKPEYVEIYRNQLKELYSNYGKLFISWHDGANGGDGFYGSAREVRKIDRTTYYGWPTTWAITRNMQPSAVIFGDVGPDVRWIGNEEGHAGETSWATYSPETPDAGKIPANGYVKHWLGVEGTRNGKYWMPAECDVSLRPGWFYHESQNTQVKSPYALLDLYYKSVGRGANLDLGLSPNKDGLLDQEDVNSLKKFGLILKETFAMNLAKNATLQAENIRGKNSITFGPKFLLDNDRYSYWATDDDIKTPSLILDLGSEKTFNVIRLRENIKLGQRIEAFTIEVWKNGNWQQIASATSIGANRLIRLPQNITAQKVRLRITKSPVAIALSDFGLYKEPVHLSAPIIRRDKNGMVSLTTDAPVSEIRYLIGPGHITKQSAIYSKPFLMDYSGLVSTAVFEGDKQSEVSFARFDANKKGWKIADVESSTKPENAIDDNPNTLWSTLKADSAAAFTPGEITIDLGKKGMVLSITYLPRQDRKLDGIVDQYTIFTSDDNKNWREVKSGEFANIRANPIKQYIFIGNSVPGRYLRFVGKRTVAGNGITAAEIGITNFEY